jgi:ribosomal protein S25
MSISSSSSPGNNEISSSSSQISDVEEVVGTQSKRLLPSSPMPLPTANSLMDGSNTPPTRVPTQAESIYVWLLNQTRIHEELIPDPTGQRILPSNTPAKWAVLSVLSTRCWLSVSVIQGLLKGLSHPCSRFSVHKALKRCGKFGLADKQKSHRAVKWKLTLAGRSLINSPRKTMKKETTADKIRTEMAKATRWMAVSDLVDIIKCSTSAARRSLRKESNPGIYKSQKIPGDRHGRNQWALSAVDTSRWQNSAPSVSPIGKGSQPRQKKTHVGGTTGRLPSTSPNLSNSPTSNSCNYKGLILMCAPSNKPSLITAVGDLLVNEFVTSGKKFSAHEVTQRLRQIELDRVKNATRAMPLPTSSSVPVDRAETGETYVSGYKVPKIEHDDVKAIVHDIFNAGGMSGLGRVVTTGGFWEYDTQANIDAAIAAQTPAPLPVATVVSGATGSTTDPDPISGGTMGSTYDGSSSI